MHQNINEIKIGDLVKFEPDRNPPNYTVAQIMKGGDNSFFCRTIPELTVNDESIDSTKEDWIYHFNNTKNFKCSVYTKEQDPEYYL